MKRLFIKFLIILTPFSSFATAQCGDIIIWNNDTLSLYSNPLELRKDIDSLRTVLFGSEDGGINTACWRGYIAEWEIIENDLFLINIYSCNYFQNNIKSDLQKLFGSKLENGKLKADWITSSLRINKGACLHYFHDGYHSIYEKEFELIVSNGVINKINEFDNSKSRKSIYAEN